MKMKTAISMPDDLFRRAEALARRRKMPRSALYAQAVREFLENHAEDDVTVQLDKVYEKEASTLDSTAMAMQRKSVLDGEW